MEEEKTAITRGLIEAVNEISAIPEFRRPVRKLYCNLARRLKLLIPMFEEIKESRDPLSEDASKSLIALKEALDSAKELLRFGAEGSKIYMVLEGEQILNKYHEVTAQLEQALSGIPYKSFDISDEVKEQVELVLTQFRRAKGRVDTIDTELFEELLSLYNNTDDTPVDPAILRKLSEKLQLMGIMDLMQESLALHEMVVVTGGDPEESIVKMSMLLKKIKDFLQSENPNLDTPPRQNNLADGGIGQAPADGNKKPPIIPEDFRCPISLKLMTDPVIVSTGQTYERSCIKKWLDAGYGTCPKTQQPVTSTELTPNYVLRSLIAQWCVDNGIEPPKLPSSSRSNKTTSACLPAERTQIEILLQKLTSGSPEDQRSAAGEIRLLAKRNADNRVAIAEAGAIPHLVCLLLTPDSRTQEHAVTAILNLSICEDNKASIIAAGAVPGIVLVLKKGSMEARENAAATLFSLSTVDENKITIGSLGAIPPLVTLLTDGTQRGKKDAATALFNLCIYQGNKGKAVRAGAIPALMHLLTEPGGGMVDEALAILAILSSHPEGKVAIGAEGAVPVLIEVIGSGSSRNRENAAAVLVHLCAADPKHMVEAQELGAMEPLADLAQNGTDRGKRKAQLLLDRISRYLEQQKLAESQTEPQTQQPWPTITYPADS